MINLDSRAFEKLISDFIDAKDIRTLVDKVSKDRAFYYYVLKDISMGRESINYKILKKVARKNKVSENFIIDQAKSVLSYIALYDEPELENYYEILNVPPNASDQEIRERWIELMKTCSPDKVGDGGTDKAKKINEAYNILGSPNKRLDYDTRYTHDIPIIVRDRETAHLSRILLYLVPFLLVVGASYLYLSSSGLIFQTESDKEIFAKSVHNPTLPNVKLNTNVLDPNAAPDLSESLITDEDLGSTELTKEPKDKYNYKIAESETEEANRPELVKIITEEDELDSTSQIDELDIGQERFTQAPGKNKDANFRSNLATPAVAVNDREFRNNEISPNGPIPDDNSLFEFVSQYVSAYKNRDLQTIRSLFAPNARENGVSIYKVLDTYEANFSTLDIIKYDVKVKRSSIDNSAGIVMGDFIVTFSNPKNNLIKSSRGSITWLLRWRGHKWEIEEINYKLYDTNVIDG